MSFRGRLTLFFLLIVVLPMIVVAVFVLQVGGDTETGKADARLAAGLDSALALYDEAISKAQGPLRDLAADPQVAQALETQNANLAHRLAADALRAKHLESLALVTTEGKELARVGAADPFAEAEVRIKAPTGVIGSVVGSVKTATAYVAEVHELTGREAVVRYPGGTATTEPLTGVRLPAPESAETVSVNGTDERAATITLTGAFGPDPTITLLGPLESGGIAQTRPFIAGVLAVFFLIALGFITLLLRALHGQTSAMLGAARRIGEGDFSQELPVEGNDEMAGLAREFNHMSGLLESQMGELRRQRLELGESVRRIGDAAAGGLDRRAVLEIVAETALGACEAEQARITMPGLDRPIEVGPPPGVDVLAALEQAEEHALKDVRAADAVRADAHALAHPLAPADPPEGEIGAISIARAQGGAFSSEQREVLRYLVAQASTSIENIALHERVSEQAITDELTGIANNRALRRWLDNEVDRATRFGHQLSLLMLDLDDFKQVNDTYGHPQGDEVLKTVGEILRRESRGIDEPARYGGEEFAVGLPETGAAGAHELAERIRARIAETDVPRVDGSGSITVTTSIGVATLPAAATDVRSLVAAADAALYEAKRRGKNRVEQASSQPDPEAKGPAGTWRK